MSEHRGHLLPDAGDMSCRGPAIVGLHADRRQRIYGGQDRYALAYRISRKSPTRGWPLLTHQPLIACKCRRPMSQAARACACATLMVTGHERRTHLENARMPAPLVF